MLNFDIGFLLGGCIAVCVLCCVQVNAVNRYEREIRRLMEFLKHSEKRNYKD